VKSSRLGKGSHARIQLIIILLGYHFCIHWLLSLVVRTSLHF
jgi:hypothetical protein